MGRLVDIDTLRKEIEKRFWSYEMPLHDDAVTSKVDEILSPLDTLSEQQEPSLSSDLDEAAERYARLATGWLPLDDERSKVNIKAFKAGTEWMASQFEKQSNSPCWKPTDDQMRALSVVGIEGAVSPKGKTLLNELYNDLEKYLFNLKMMEK